MIYKLFIILSAFIASFSGSPELFKKTSFFEKPDSLVPNSLKLSLTQLENIEKDFKEFAHDLLEWGKSYHALRIQIQGDVLSEILSHTGQSDFLKELGKCGVIEALETEDMVTVKSICFSENTVQELVSILMKELKTNSDACVNVKQKFKNRINEAYDEFLDEQKSGKNAVQTEGISVYTENGLLQSNNEEKRFESISKKHSSPTNSICEKYHDLSRRVSILTGTTDSILSTLF